VLEKKIQFFDGLINKQWKIEKIVTVQTISPGLLEWMRERQAVQQMARVYLLRIIFLYSDTTHNSQARHDLFKFNTQSRCMW
jgi:hypothetical protein